ncbi:MAG: hypothetical protein APR63_02950 [Desulfuromonas sp. SDB]|nr:MAG: hypothetical protein APR63_02950 [Desulfuromonas sp. SDB]
MYWVKEFYLKQQEWANVYGGGITEYHRKNAELVKNTAQGKLGDILELGAGGGQNAAALAELGYSVTAVELIPQLAGIACKFTSNSAPGKIEVLQDDFYEINLEKKFDIICYWDGFGIGSDDDQIRLLNRIADWLKEDGFALIEIYNPGYWKKTVGKTMKFGKVNRRYDYDYQNNRMLDRWWLRNFPENSVCQSLRCYKPEDLKTLLAETGLNLKGIYNDNIWIEDNLVDNKSMQYMIKLVKNK